MKLKYIFSIILSSALLFAGCIKDEPTGSFDNIKVDKTYLSISENGGNVTVKLTATEAWEFVSSDSWPEVITRDKEGNVTKRTPSWLSTASVMSGEAGDYDITFSAEAAVSGREVDIEVKAGSNTQVIRIRQGSLEASSATCAEVIAGPDGKTFRVKGVCTAISNTTYGNWYINDGTGEVLVYGTLDEKGAEKNFLSWGLEVGDEVDIEGPKTTYNGTVELVNVTVNKITKSLLKIVTEQQSYSKDGGEYDVKVAYKGDNLDTFIAEELRDWVSVVNIKTIAGIPSKLEQNPADTAIVTIKLLPNQAGDRPGSIAFKSANEKGSTELSYDFVQEGAIIDATAAEINAAEDGAVQYRLTGVVSKIANTKYGNLYIKDATGEVFVYGTNDFEASGIEEDDIVTVVGPKTSYNGAPQMKNVTVEKRVPVQDIDLASFRALKNNKEAWYKISGTVVKSSEEGTKFDLEQYGNFALSDGTTEVYVYGVKTGWGGAKGQFGTLGVKEGDNLTIICYKTSYNELVEADGCVYVSHEPAQVDDPVVGEAESILMTSCFTEDTNLEEGKTYTWGSLSATFEKHNSSSTSNYKATDPGLRFYKDDVLTLSAEKNIVKLEFVFYGGKTGPFTADSGEVSSSETSVIWTGDAKTVVLTASNQIRFNEIKVTYKQ